MSIELTDDEAEQFVEFVEQLDSKWSAANQYQWSVPQVARFVSGDETFETEHYTVENYGRPETATRVVIY